MKKIILLTIGIVAVCIFRIAMYANSRKDDTTSNEKEVVTTSEVYGDYEIIIIDSCEYIRGYRDRLAHKGNCKFCEERRKKELEDLVDKLNVTNYESKNKGNR